MKTRAACDPLNQMPLGSVYNVRLIFGHNGRTAKGYCRIRHNPRHKLPLSHNGSPVRIRSHRRSKMNPSTIKAATSATAQISLAISKSTLSTRFDLGKVKPPWTSIIFLLRIRSGESNDTLFKVVPNATLTGDIHGFLASAASPRRLSRPAPYI
jgi:hypothetical protein